MHKRHYSPADQLIAQGDRALRTLFGRPPQQRPNPADDKPDTNDDDRARRETARLMRVNHAGEIAAQALYHGQAVVAHSAKVRTAMQRAADEENDHLAWCEERLQELGDRTSLLNPVWYAGSFAIGALAGIVGDRWSLGFVDETERQVVEHLEGHLQRIPETDARSRAIIEQMKTDEAHHGESARRAGAARLPAPVRRVMRMISKVMTQTAYWV